MKKYLQEIGRITWDDYNNQKSVSSAKWFSKLTNMTLLKNISTDTST